MTNWIRFETTGGETNFIRADKIVCIGYFECRDDRCPDRWHYVIDVGSQIGIGIKYEGFVHLVRELEILGICIIDNVPKPETKMVRKGVN